MRGLAAGERPTRARVVSAFLLAPVGGFLICSGLAFVRYALDGRGLRDAAGLALFLFIMATTFGTPVAWLVQLLLVLIGGPVPGAGRRGVVRTIATGTGAGALVPLGVLLYSGDHKSPLVAMFLGALLGAGSALTYCAMLTSRTRRLQFVERAS